MCFAKDKKVIFGVGSGVPNSGLDKGLEMEKWSRHRTIKSVAKAEQGFLVGLWFSKVQKSVFDVGSRIANNADAKGAK